MRALLLALAAGVVLAVAVPAATSAPAAQEVTIASADGTRLAATLHLPAGAPPPGGWPAVVFMHGLGGDRASMSTLARAMGMVGDAYAVLAVDARGHGESGGLIGIDGPNEVADARAVFGWLRDRPDVSDTRIGAFGVSLGGGAVWNSLVAGVPWTAVAVGVTWTNLQTALMPQGIVKSGIVAGFLSLLDPARVDPAVVAARDAALAGDVAAVTQWAAARSSVRRLAGISTPAFLMQARRDFAFGLDQALAAWRLLAGPKRLWIGNAGHAPSTFPAADTDAMLAAAKRWFDRFLRGVTNGAATSKPVTVAGEGSARTAGFATLPATRVRSRDSAGSDRIGPAGKVVRTLPPAPLPLESFGTPTVQVRATTTGGWPRLVAVLTATTGSTETVVAAGGVPARRGARTYTIRLSSQATVIPKGAKLTIVVAASSQTPTTTLPLYLDRPVPGGASVTIGRVVLRLPTLEAPVAR